MPLYLLLQDDSPSGANVNALGVHLLVSLFFVLGTMIEFAIVLLLKRITGYSDNQIPSSKNSEGRRKNSRTGKLHCFYKRNSGGRNPDTNSVETNSIDTNLDTSSIESNPFDSNSIPELREEPTNQTENRQKRRYLITAKIDFVAFFVFMFSYIIFNIVYVAHYM